VQVGTPLKLIRPCLSNSKVSDFSPGGALSFSERIRTVLEKLVGRVPWAGKARGSNSAVALTFSGPIWVVIASAAAAPTSAATTPATSATATRRLIPRLIPSPGSFSRSIRSVWSRQ
jgi:hypothetical protein